MPRILIVDDSPTQTIMLKASLIQHNHLVEFESCGAAGLKRAQDSNFDLLIFDLNLPDMSGLDICRQYKSLGYTTPILLVTSEDQMSKVAAHQGPGPDFCCIKDQIAILNRVEIILFRQRRRQSLSSPNS
jgi:OmpR-family two-component system manganese-sensing response regulator